MLVNRLRGNGNNNGNGNGNGNDRGDAAAERRGGPIGFIVKGVATGIGLAAESYHHRQDKKKAQQSINRDQQPSRDPQGLQIREDQPAELDGEPSSPATAAAVEMDAEQQMRNDYRLSRQLDEATWALDDAAREEQPRGAPPAYSPMTYDVAAAADYFVQRHPPPSHPLRSYPVPATAFPPSTSTEVSPISPYSPSSSPFYSAGTMPPAPPPPPPRGLTLPVVITQRRPKNRVRGFVRAYAPMLQDADIDQATFLDFIDQLNKAVEPSPLINALNLASLAGLAVPEPFTILISIGVQLATQAANEAHSRSKTNSYLDKMNETFFAPRGLVALVMTWKPGSAETVTNVNIDTDMDAAINKAASSSAAAAPTNMMTRVGNRMKSSTGKTSFEWPETAPLVFPELDALAAGGGDDDAQQQAKKQSAVKRGGDFVKQYLDKRAQAEWAGENPDSRMANAAPKPEFRSRYADPNHPASNGELISLLTGGHIHSGKLSGFMPQRGGLVSTLVTGRGLMDIGSGRGTLGGGGGGGRDARGRGYGGGRRPDADYGEGGRGGSRPQQVLAARGASGMSLVGGVRKLLQNDVLYLMIVNRPTEEEMAHARQVLAMMS